MSAASDFTREQYRSRIREGDVVYFVEGEEVTGAGKLKVKKATVVEAEHERRYPVIRLWDTVYTEPTMGTTVAKSPREIFTIYEVTEALKMRPDGEAVDTLVDDPYSNIVITGALGAIVTHRLADDEARRPGDPEY